MRRTVIHYDEVTECGLLREASGSMRYFRKGDPDDPGNELADQPVPTVAVMDPVPAPVMTPTAKPPIRGLRLTGTHLDWVHWVGVFLSGLALLLLINAGGKGLNPKLIDSWWGISAAVLLMIQLIFFSIGVATSKLRTNYWRIVVCTLMASLLLKSCDNYQADTTADVYSITLGLLLLVVYLLPKQQGR